MQGKIDVICMFRNFRYVVKTLTFTVRSYWRPTTLMWPNLHYLIMITLHGIFLCRNIFEDDMGLARVPGPSRAPKLVQLGTHVSNA